MRFLFAVFTLSFFSFSCSKEESLSFDDSVRYARDYKIDPVSRDTIYQIFLPNAFTPNSDGINDYYLVYGEGILKDNFSMRVFERNGNLVFTSENKYLGWSGKMAGHSTFLPRDQYNVLVTAADSTGEIHRYDYKILLCR